MNSQDFENGILNDWLKSIELKGKDSDILIVGTHSDLHKRELPDQLKNRFKQIERG